MSVADVDIIDVVDGIARAAATAAAVVGGTAAAAVAVSVVVVVFVVVAAAVAHALSPSTARFVLLTRNHRAMLLRPSRSNVPLLKTWPRQA